MHRMKWQCVRHGNCLAIYQVQNTNPGHCVLSFKYSFYGSNPTACPLKAGQTLVRHGAVPYSLTYLRYLARNKKNHLRSPYPPFVVVSLLLLVSAWSFPPTTGVPGRCSTLSACLRSVRVPTSHIALSTPLKTTVGE